MPTNTRKWFWTAVLAWAVSLAAMFAAKACAVQVMVLTARAAQANANGPALGNADDSKVLVSRYLLYFGIFDATSLVFGVLMLAAWAVSRFKGERRPQIVLVVMLLALFLFYFLGV